MNRVLQRNREAWNERVRRGLNHTETARDRDFHDPMAVVDDCGWLGGSVHGKRVLCLAAGGGKHGALFAAAGAQVTVVDLSSAMLDLDRKMARERGLTMRLIEASMDDLTVLATAKFDIVVQPVSTCYVPDVLAVYREVARVTVAGGLYISQHKQPATLQTEVTGTARGYVLNESYYRTGPLPEIIGGCLHREAGTVEFLHRWQELVGGLCRSGFLLEDLEEPLHGDPLAEPGTFQHRSAYVPPFVTLKARRRTDVGGESATPRLWTPQ